MTQTNRKVPDQLADVREQIRELKAREDELRNLLILGKADLVGDDYTAVISRIITERIDIAQLRKELGLERLKPFLVPSESVVIRLEPMKAEANVP